MPVHNGMSSINCVLGEQPMTLTVTVIPTSALMNTDVLLYKVTNCPSHTSSFVTRQSIVHEL